MRVAVLGAGLQGACVALELARHGVAVDLYDRSDQCLSQASARNEGKIHLGYVYANDHTRQTARAMIRGALSFAPLLRRWLGDALDRVPVSAPFHYVVHRESLLSVDEVEAHFADCHKLALEELAGSAPDYFGGDPRQLPQRLTAGECDSLFDRRRLLAVYQTAELGLDPEALAAAVRGRLASDPHIRRRLRTQVLGVVPDSQGASVTVAAVDPATDDPSGKRADEHDHEHYDAEHYDHVVNALWDGRLAIDQTAGLAPPRPWTYRVKHYLRVESRALRVPSATIVLGAFGDTVAYANGCFYLSWYPAGMRGFSTALVPPAWPLELEEPAASAVRRAITQGLTDIIPDVGTLDADALATVRLQAGVIVAWGRTDIDDPRSGLHERHAIGPHSHGRYHTVDTGKLTVAPLFGKLLADRILESC